MRSLWQCGQLGRDVAAAAVQAGCSALIRGYLDERRRPGITGPPLAVIQSTDRHTDQQDIAACPWSCHVTHSLHGHMH